jgi:hypothetical protein
MGSAPGHGDEAAVGVAEQVEALEAEVLAHRRDGRASAGPDPASRQASLRPSPVVRVGTIRR